jgi:hypothetical protein
MQMGKRSQLNGHDDDEINDKHWEEDGRPALGRNINAINH